MPDFAVACGHALTAEAAENVLRDGGTAADAAIAGAFMAMVAEPILAGLLGGGFAMVAAEGQTRLLDFFVQTPKRRADEIDFRSVFADFGTTRQEFHIGAGSVATPGIAPGLAELHARAGRMPLRELARPAIEAARSGVRITPFQAALGRIVAPILNASAEASKLMCADGTPLAEGAIYTNPDFADVLEVFAIEGARFVTEGEVARALLDLVDQRGYLSSADLRGYRPVWREPVVVERAGAKIHLNPPPSLGGRLVELSLALIGRDASPVEIARAFQATSRARLETGDDADGLIAPELIKKLRQQLAAHPAATRGTTHISVIDREGRGAALTLSNGEGCGLIARGTGIMPNNMLGEEDLVPGGWHSWPRDSRLASMMCPLAVRWPDTALAMLGSGGSNRIRTALTQVLVRMLDHGWPISDAIDAPRLHVENEALDFEVSGLAEKDRVALLNAYPEATLWPEPSMFFGGAHGVIRDRKGGFMAAGDARRAGVAFPAADYVAG
ncbi:gamma-glutamyltransferase [Rhodobacteraceae bacterium NNCM2]|nr:gamma-glutamyltransferase [Coraliihabitans acroporae]